MLLGVTNKKQVLIDLGIDDIWEADDTADDNIAGGIMCFCLQNLSWS